MNILFIGCIESSYIELSLLIENNKSIVGVITKEKSNFNADFCNLGPLCEENNIPYIYSIDINDNSSVKFIRECNPDIIYCFGWSQLIKSEILNIPKLGVIGNHPAELPKNRGRHPIIWALALGLKQTASTFFIMNEGADTGKIISQRIIPISDTDFARDLYDKITKNECEQIIEFTNQFENNEIIYFEQSNKSGNEWRKRSRVDGLIDWRMSSKAIYNLVRALSEPYVGAGFIYNGREVKVWKVEEISGTGYENIEPGKVIKVVNKNDYYIKSYDNIIHVLYSEDFDGKEGDYL